MGYVVAAYLVVLGAMGFYWWTLYARTARLLAEFPENSSEKGDSGPEIQTPESQADEK